MRALALTLALTLSVAGGFTLSACQNSTTSDKKTGNKAKSEAETSAIKRLDAVLVARVGTTPIFQSDVERLAAERGVIKSGQPLSQTHPQYPELLESLIDQRLLAQAAINRALDQTDDNKRRLAAARERILSNILIEQHLKEKVNDTTIQRLYEEQAALADRGDEVRARHILLSDKASAEAALKTLEGGESFADLARSISLDTASRENGGDIGYVTRDMPPPDLAAVIFNTPEGGQSDIFQTEMGWHILEVVDRRPARRQSLEDVRPNIVKFLTFEAIDTLIADLRSQTEVETFFKTPVGPTNLDPLNNEGDVDPAETEPREEEGN